MPIGGIKALFVRKEHIGIMKKKKELSMQYGFAITKCCCQPYDNADLLSGVDSLPHV